MLVAYNGLTSYHVRPDTYGQIKGFWPALNISVVAWRDEMIRAFRFDRSKGVQEGDLRGLATKYRKEQASVFGEVERQLTELEGLEATVRRQLAGLVPDIRVAV